MTKEPGISCLLSEKTMLDRWVARRIGCAGVLTRTALEAWQLKCLQETVEWARSNSSFYRERLPDGCISSFEQFSTLPFTAADDLCSYGRQMLCISPKEIERVVTLATSGSTGSPKRVFFTHAEQENTVAYFQNGMAEYVSTGERIMILFPGNSPGSLNDLLSRALIRLGTEPVLFGFPKPEQYRMLLDAILAQKIDFLVGPAEAIAGAARMSHRLGTSSKLAGQVRGVLLSASYVSPENRAEIERTWDCSVYEHYGMTETGLTGAVGCQAPDGYHIWESDLYYEIVDPNRGTLVPDGERGEVVVTTLSRKGMPFIRYRTGDFSRILPGPCPCGSILRRLDRIEPRGVPKAFTERNTSLTELVKR